MAWLSYKRQFELPEQPLKSPPSQFWPSGLCALALACFFSLRLVGPWDSNPRSGSKVGVDGSRVLGVAVSLAGQSCCFDGSESAVGSSCSGGSGTDSVLIIGSWAVGVEVPVSLAGLSC